MSEALNIAWKSPGPVANACHLAAPPKGGAQILNGPIGSGKTTERLMKAINLARQQAPSPRRFAVIKDRHGHDRKVQLRLFKLCVVRDNYRQLWRSTLPSWWKRVPKTVGDWTGAENAPGTHHILFELGDGTAVDFHADFIAIGENSVEDVMRGYEPTFFYLNELDLLSPEVLTYAQGRAGRYPDMADGGPTSWGILADCNAPEFESWLYAGNGEPDPMTGKPKPGIFTMTPEQLEAAKVQLFRQPGGRSPNAENLDNLPTGYYEPKATMKRGYIARMIDNKPGYSEAGMPVHPDFNPDRHVATRELDPIPGLGLVIGLDPKTYPSAVFMQRLANGQRRILDELQGEPNMGANRFGERVAQRLHDRFPMFSPRQIRGMVDPTAALGADKEAGELDWIEIFEGATGVRVQPAPSNNLDMRRAALRVPLTRDIDQHPAIVIDPRCTTMIAGLASGFRFRKLNTPGATKYSEEVEKNHYADLCEAAEYACLSDGAELEIKERKDFDRRRTAALAQSHKHEWDPYGGGG